MYSIALKSHKTDPPATKWENWNVVVFKDDILTLEEAFAWRHKLGRRAVEDINFGNDIYALEIKDVDTDQVIWNKLLEQQRYAS